MAETGIGLRRCDEGGDATTLYPEPLVGKDQGQARPRRNERAASPLLETSMPAPYEKHRAQLKAILLAWGMPQESAETTADVLSWADLHGVDSHGISMLPGYDRLRRSGRANMEARPRIIKETPVSALVDGDGGLGHVPARFAMRVAIDKAKEAGMAITAVRNSAHFGATGYYTLMAAKEGLIGMACTGASSIQVAPTFGRGSQARHRPLVLCRSDGGWAAVFARYGDDDRGRRP